MLEQDTASFFEEGSFSSQMWYAVNMSLTRSISQDEDSPLMLTSPSIIFPALPISQKVKEKAIRAVPLAEFSTSGKLDYQKNICANITKKAVQCFISSNYHRRIRRLCEKHECQFEEAHDFYQQKLRDVFGLSHLFQLVTPESAESTEKRRIKQVFAAFLKWFLRERYMLYMLRFGKMSDREKYIEFKNKYLLYIEQVILEPILMD